MRSLRSRRRRSRRHLAPPKTKKKPQPQTGAFIPEKSNVWRDACDGYIDWVKEHVLEGATLDEADLCGDPPLLLAAGNGHVAVAAFLLDEGASVEQRNVVCVCVCFAFFCGCLVFAGVVGVAFLPTRRRNGRRHRHKKHTHTPRWARRRSCARRTTATSPPCSCCSRAAPTSRPPTWCVRFVVCCVCCVCCVLCAPAHARPALQTNTHTNARQGDNTALHW